MKSSTDVIVVGAGNAAFENVPRRPCRGEQSPAPILDPAEVTAARAKVPSLQHGRRFEVSEPMAEPAHLHAVRGPA